MFLRLHLSLKAPLNALSSTLVATSFLLHRKNVYDAHSSEVKKNAIHMEFIRTIGKQLTQRTQ